MATTHPTLFDNIREPEDTLPPPRPLPKNPRFHNLTGLVRNRWTFLYFVGPQKWVCRCECGRQKVVSASSILSGRSVSCGCYQIEFAKRSQPKATAAWTKHRKCDTSEYTSWKGMIARCCNQNSIGYENYGGRGIKPCERYRQSFTDFLADLGKKPSKKHSIDRIDNSAGYTCGKCDECIANGWTANVQWATKKQQAWNRRTTRMLTLNGETKPICVWADEIGLSHIGLRSRLKRGWPLELALTTPPLT